MRICVDKPPVRRRAVDAFVDLLSDCSVQAAVALGEAGDAQPARQAGERPQVDARNVELGCGRPANPAFDLAIVAAAEDSVRILPREYMVDAGYAITMRAEAAHLRQEVRRRPILCQRHRNPGARVVVAAENPTGAREVPSRRNEHCQRLLQTRAARVGGESNLAQRGDREVARTPARQTIVECMFDPPLSLGAIEDEDLRALRPLRSGCVFPIAVAGVELVLMRGKHAYLGATHQSPGSVSHTRCIRDVKVSNGIGTCTERCTRHAAADDHYTQWALHSRHCLACCWTTDRSTRVATRGIEYSRQLPPAA